MKRLSTLMPLLCSALVATPSWAMATSVPINPHLPKETTATPKVKKVLEGLRKQFAHQKFTFQVGLTSVSHFELNKITGLKIPGEAQVSKVAKETNELAKKLLEIEQKAIVQWEKKNNQKIHHGAPASCESAGHYDLRKVNAATHIKNQGGCGSCWDFAAMSSLESSWALRNKGQKIDASEQEVLDCSGGGTCAGGWYMPVFTWLQGTPNSAGSDSPYKGSKGSCKKTLPKKYAAVAWGFVHANGGTPNNAEMKKAMCKYGAVAVAVQATAAFQSYTGGVFNEGANGQINHAVSLIGWDDSKGAWLMKNSWGQGWGENGGDAAAGGGYMWIKYGTNKIGYNAAWVQAKSTVVDHCPRPEKVNIAKFGQYVDSISSLPADAKKELKEVAADIVGSFFPGCRPLSKVELVGYTDPDKKKPPKFHQDLSLKRANAVKAALAKELGKNASKVKFTVKGMGDKSPVKPPGSVENRRVMVSTAN